MKTKTIILAILAAILFYSCSKNDEKYCDCTKKTYSWIQNDIGKIESETICIPFEDLGELDGYGGIDENGNTYSIECD